jgi:hypothetical protein
VDKDIQLSDERTHETERRVIGVVRMERDAPLKKTITVAGQRVELCSLDDGATWSSDLEQLRERMKRREEEQARVLDNAKKFLKSRPGLADKSRV